jgi:hypothetical protein
VKYMIHPLHNAFGVAHSTWLTMEAGIPCSYTLWCIDQITSYWAMHPPYGRHIVALGSLQ